MFSIIALCGAESKHFENAYGYMRTKAFARNNLGRTP